MVGSGPTSETSVLATLLPEGTARPREIPPEIFDAALRAFFEQRRLDMKDLALELGISRATLYRKVRGRDHLLGEVVWWLTRMAIERALLASERRQGARRVLAIVERFMNDVHDQPAFRRLLDAEPEAALRILTSKAGPVQAGVVATMTAVIAEERGRGNLESRIDDGTLAYVIVRIGEGFLYSDVIADAEPDVGKAVQVVAELLRA